MRQPVPFGKYLLLDRVSVGGMAEVFKAKSYGVEGFEKIIAIKRILPTMGEDRDFIKMFIDEAKIAGQLAHANICQIFELGRIDGAHFIAMEYIWGKDLLQIQNRLRKIKQAMPIAMACFVIAKVLEGLDYAHRKRDPLGRPLEIVHRDCSPQNVLVSYEGEVKVIDFGIAKATSRNSRTMAGVLKGKFGYMSPEQVRGLPLDRRSDIFAIGTMLYECLTGDRLFQGETDFSTLEKVRNVDIRPPRELNPAIPERIEYVLLKALSKDVDERYQWCSEMLADLQQWLMGQEIVVTAKSLSAWLKDVFTAEIDKERQQLEHYKRVGRDGLIAGMPAAEAKLDVVEHLGEAPPVEGDATQLGGPDFDDVVPSEAAPSAGPAPGSPATRASADSLDEGGGDFGEEMPTEIFGEIEHGPKPVPAAPASAVAAVVQATAPAPSILGAAPPPARPAAYERAASQPPTTPFVRPSPPALAHAATMLAGEAPVIAPASAGAQPEPAPQPSYPGYVAYPPQPAPAAPPARTLIGAVAPQLPANYGSYPPPGYPSAPQLQPQPLYNHGGYYPPPQQPQAYPQPTYSQPYQAPYPPHYDPYASGPQPVVAPLPPMVTATVAPLKTKSGSIGRDIAIGVVIAVVVLGGFLAVKFLILDAEDGSEVRASTGEATLALDLGAPDLDGDLFLDGSATRTQAVRSGALVPVKPGKRVVRLVARGGTECTQEVVLADGEQRAIRCQLAARVAAPPVDAAAPPADAAAPPVDAAPPPVDASVAAVAEPEPKRPTQPAASAASTDDNPADKAMALPSKGYVMVTSSPTNAKLAIDGVETDQTTPVRLSLSPGKHRITFITATTRMAYSVTVKAGDTQPLHKDLQ